MRKKNVQKKYIQINTFIIFVIISCPWTASKSSVIISCPNILSLDCIEKHGNLSYIDKSLSLTPTHNAA